MTARKTVLLAACLAVASLASAGGVLAASGRSTRHVAKTSVRDGKQAAKRSARRHHGHAAAVSQPPISAFGRSPAASPEIARSVVNALAGGRNLGSFAQADVKDLRDTAAGSVYAVRNGQAICVADRDSHGSGIACAPRASAENPSTAMSTLTYLPDGFRFTALLPDSVSAASLRLSDGSNVSTAIVNNVVDAKIDAPPADFQITTSSGKHYHEDLTGATTAPTPSQ